LPRRQVRERLGVVVFEFAAAFAHELDSPRMHPARWPRAGAKRLDPSGRMEPGERLGHLAAARVLDADEQDTLRRMGHEGCTPAGAGVATFPGGSIGNGSRPRQWVGSVNQAKCSQASGFPGEQKLHVSALYLTICL